MLSSKVPLDIQIRQVKNGYIIEDRPANNCLASQQWVADSIETLIDVIGMLAKNPNVKQEKPHA